MALLLLFATQYDVRTAAVFTAVLSPFVVLCLFMLRMAFRETMRLVRYRSLQLRLETCPAVLGGRLSGAVAGATGVLHEAMSFRLVCWRRSGGDGDDYLLWEKVMQVPKGFIRPSAGTSLPFNFSVPSTYGPTGGDDPESCGRSL
ncbi:MAG: hypothetical protein H0V80_00800 [Acidobacteria bacterium]|nr:hypothetical protein [Acidobacteriota bacterium]